MDMPVKVTARAPTTVAQKAKLRDNAAIFYSLAFRCVFHPLQGSAVPASAAAVGARVCLTTPREQSGMMEPRRSSTTLLKLWLASVAGCCAFAAFLAAIAVLPSWLRPASLP
eukprot:PLAT8968.2.p2 GENE.PLAT8968.2~~PLAT8968.2.p2  ORF type:complete len:112 (-),score=12.78 PLAT8968.2:171-506(-)